jgi:hypothetical protein
MGGTARHVFVAAFEAAARVETVHSVWNHDHLNCEINHCRAMGYSWSGQVNIFLS